MRRNVSVTVQLKMDLAVDLGKAEFPRTLEWLLRSGLGGLLNASPDSVALIAADDPLGELTKAPDLTPVLEPRGEIAVIWAADDVRRLRPELSRDQAIQVLRFCEQHHNPDDGINWHCLDLVAEQLFGRSAEGVIP
ncbi:MAG: hypothetical protein R3C19_25375 [Planctomycetaceae bacterium]